MTRTVVYTAQFGDYDPIMPVLEPTPGVDHLVLSDRTFRVPRPWRVHTVQLPEGLPNDRLRNRWCKLHASRLLADYDRSVYVDAHLQLVGDLTPLLDGFAVSGAPVGLMRHPHSRTIDEEIERSLRTGRITRRDHDLNWPEQRARYQAAGFPADERVMLGWVVLREHRRPEVASFEGLWWDELLGGVTRDQVALPFVLWKLGISPWPLPLDWSLSPYLRHWKHLRGSDRMGRLHRWFDARVALRPQYRWVLRALRPGAAFHAFRARMSDGPG